MYGKNSKKNFFKGETFNEIYDYVFNNTQCCKLFMYNRIYIAIIIIAIYMKSMYQKLS